VLPADARCGQSDEGGALEANVGDEIVVDRGEVGHRSRKGAILEVRRELGDQHYRVRSEVGHKSSFDPTSTTPTVQVKR
jgi:hypothetical protein